MDTSISRHLHLRRLSFGVVSLFAALAIAVPATGISHAEAASPFVGNWRATDPADGSDIRLAIGGPPAGPFQITWTESYVGFCSGEAGMVRGMGWLDPNATNRLQASLRVECLASGDYVDFDWQWRYHPYSNTLSSLGGNGVVIVWTRPRHVQEGPPALDLRVNYGADDWVESFYEAGHAAWVTLTDADGNVLATTELITESKWYWDGGTGFSSLDSIWIDPEGSPMEDAPDIQPTFWVYGWMDNGASAQVQIGEITGAIDLSGDTITGTVFTTWYVALVEVECLDWGSGEQPPFLNKHGGLIPTDGETPYSCSWSGEWDIQPGQTVGVAYTGPDGQWVANSFVVPNPNFVAYLPSAIEGYDWPMGSLVTVDINDGEYVEVATSEQREGAPPGATRVLFKLWEHPFVMAAGDYITMTDGVVTKDTVVTSLAVTAFDLGTGTIKGNYDPSHSLEVWLYGEDPQVPELNADGTWLAIFESLPPNTWGGATQREIGGDGDGTSVDFRIPNPSITAWMGWKVIEGFEFQRDGLVSLSIGPLTYEGDVEPAPWDPFDPTQSYVRFDIGADGHSLQAGDVIVMSDGYTTKELTVPALEVSGYDLGSGTVRGIYDPALSFSIAIGDLNLTDLLFEGETWLATFSGLGTDMWGDAIQTDSDGDDARATIHTPSPMMYALAQENITYGNGYEVGEELVLTVYDAATGLVAYQASQLVPPPSDVPWTYVLFNLNPYDLKPGDRLVMQQGSYVRELIVSSLQISDFDLATRTILGAGDPDSAFFVRIHGVDAWSTASANGEWSVQHDELLPGRWGEAIQPDEDGDETRDGFQAPLE